MLKSLPPRFPSGASGCRDPELDRTRHSAPYAPQLPIERTGRSHCLLVGHQRQTVRCPFFLVWEIAFAEIQCGKAVLAAMFDEMIEQQMADCQGSESGIEGG